MSEVHQIINLLSLVPLLLFFNFWGGGDHLTNHVVLVTLFVVWVAGKDGVCHFSGKFNWFSVC